VRYCHFFNFLFVMMLIRSGLSILMDHPRLYFNDGCTPGSEWIRLTPLKVPRDRIWTAKDDARYISPLVGTPGYRHTIGIARVGHFIDVHGFIITGILFVIMLFDTEQWRRIVPTSPLVLLQAWKTWVHYATFPLLRTVPLSLWRRFATPSLLWRSRGREIPPEPPRCKASVMSRRCALVTTLPGTYLLR
jgi:sulfoxide reductase catalytic subunit YedY